MRKFLGSAGLSFLLITGGLTGCAATRTYNVSPPISDKAPEIGETVVITLKNGKRFKGVVVELNDVELVTRNNRYAWKDIREVSYKRDDSLRASLESLGWGSAVIVILCLGFIAAMGAL